MDCTELVNQMNLDLQCNITDAVDDENVSVQCNQHNKESNNESNNESNHQVNTVFNWEVLNWSKDQPVFSKSANCIESKKQEELENEL